MRSLPARGTMRILVLNGPNLNLLGTREPEIYGSETLDGLDRRVAQWANDLGVEVETLQSNHEGDLVDQIHRTDVDGIVLNPAAYSYTSRAIQDAIAAVDTPLVEVHISNIKDREPWRSHSLVSEVADYTIFGRGRTGYRDAIRHLVNAATVPFVTQHYGDDDEQVGDLRKRGGTLAMLVHGGFWLEQWTRDIMESLAVDLASHQVSTWNIEYRRLGSGGGWPASLDDVTRALEHTSELGDWSRVAVIGHSAGAYMGMLASRDSRVSPDLVVALAPVVDLERHASSSLFASDIARRLRAEGAPAVVTPGSVPLLLVHGEGDVHVPIDHAERLADATDAELIRTGLGHFELLDPDRAHWEAVRKAVIG